MITCPVCSARAHYSAGLAVVVCKSCRLWTLKLTPQQNRELLAATLGQSDLPIDHFLAEVERRAA